MGSEEAVDGGEAGERSRDQSCRQRSLQRFRPGDSAQRDLAWRCRSRQPGVRPRPCPGWGPGPALPKGGVGAAVVARPPWPFAAVPGALG